jgi:glycosyltransferase involved in cell wall biosynthesis
LTQTGAPGRAYWHADIVMTPAAARIRDATTITQPYDDTSLDLTFFVSCYNEAGSIVETLDILISAAKEVGLSYEIVVIDDCSRDNSREVVREYIVGHPDDNIALVANRTNKGLAQNYLDGAFIGRGKYYRLICGDSAEPRETIVTVLKAIGEADCIVPYHVSVPGRTASRRVISKAYTNIINAITGNDIHYYNGLAVHLRHNVMRWHTNTRGFGFQAEILCLLIDLGFTYKQVPVHAHEQRPGKSNALKFRNLLSVAHTIVEIANRRVSSLVYPSRR